MIDEPEFWSLIDQSRAAADGDPAAQGEELRKLLTGRNRQELESFARIYETLQARAYHWDCWAAGYLLAGGMTEEGFSDFREWLISRGERVYRLALEDPETLADEVPEDEPELTAEGLWFVAHELYAEAFGEKVPIFDDVPVPREPAGEPWQEDDLEARFPRLWRRLLEED